MDCPAVQEDRFRAKLDHRRDIVAYEDDRRPTVDDFLHLVEAFLLEADVAYAQHLVDQEDLGVHMGGNRETQPGIHS
jgi:hypothetical protein